ncbi:phosphosulfolactate synthase [Peribacillus glennii]|uniref:Phosphosulfolactate synthase n=1 Tax=Peribacillus glennii TaxID=2303991 RepID=A0A372LGA5_9BACI|nr:phosphosulfolactate synthase [Peribacillus glennii]RFU65335.1 phosphosulfolactate synthase [Peribacillus glennii]
MNLTGLVLPNRENKPRTNGLTIVIDNGTPIQFFKDTINSAGDYIDFVKFGWGTSLVTRHLGEKIECLQENNIEYFFGGTLFEKYVSQGKVDNFYQYCKNYDCRFIEVSNGTIDITNKEKARFIRDFSTEFSIFSEIGKKDGDLAELQSDSEWLEYIHEDLEAGSTKVITEARESGTSGICSKDGTLRVGLIEQLLTSGIGLERLIFEAPTKKMQTFFINSAGSNVNLANIPFTDPIALETLRLGLRSDTFSLLNKQEIGYAGFK